MRVNPTAKVNCRGDGWAEQAQRHDAVAIDEVNRDLTLRGDRAVVGRHDERRVVVRDHEASLGREFNNQPAAGLLRCLDEGPIGDAEFLRRGRVVAHPFEHEGVMPGTRPRVVQLQTFVDHERLVQLAAHTQRVIERMIRVKPAKRLHPVQHVAPGGIHWAIVREAKAGLVETCHSGSTAVGLDL